MVILWAAAEAKQPLPPLSGQDGTLQPDNHPRPGQHGCGVSGTSRREPPADQQDPLGAAAEYMEGMLPSQPDNPEAIGSGLKLL